jgi:hypothetical protein
MEAAKAPPRVLFFPKKSGSSLAAPLVRSRVGSPAGFVVQEGINGSIVGTASSQVFQ